VNRFVDIRADRAQAFFMGMLRDDLRLIITSEDRADVPAPFYDATDQNEIECRLVEEWDSQEKSKCLLQSKPFYEDGDATYYTLQHFSLANYSVNEAGVRKFVYTAFPRIAYQTNEEWNLFPITVKKDDFYFDGKGTSIEIKSSLDPAVVRAVMDAFRDRQIGQLRPDFGVFVPPPPPPPDPECFEGTHWEPAISQCMPDEPPLSPPPSCGEAVWDAATEDCECEEDKIYNSTAKRCDIEETCTGVDCEAGLPPGGGGGQGTDESVNGGGCSLQRGQVLTFHFLPGFLVFILFVLRHRARRIL
ncbi:MAG: hypothetical protein Q8P84_05860, partial [Deltaproteobacteria bacterium]|nr:hypothetical protein [Deltaproteobacteria bacterium]